MSRRTATVKPSAQCAAWDAYRSVSTGLLPALYGNEIGSAEVKSQLGAVAIRIVRYWPLWGAHGAMLIAALHSAMRLYRQGDGDELTGMIQDIGDRLYLLSASPDRQHHRSEDPAPP
jgi:hypothetical protein